MTFNCYITVYSYFFLVIPLCYLFCLLLGLNEQHLRMADSTEHWLKKKKIKKGPDSFTFQTIFGLKSVCTSFINIVNIIISIHVGLVMPLSVKWKHQIIRIEVLANPMNSLCPVELFLAPPGSVSTFTQQKPSNS